MTKIISILTLMLLPMALQAQSLLEEQPEIQGNEAKESQLTLHYGDFDAIPDTPFGDKVKLGYELFVNSQQMNQTYVGNNQNCVNCHLNAGQNANSAPLGPAFFAYPAFRSKNKKINSYEERIQGCFVYSMNGIIPKSGSKELVAISAYSYWLGAQALYRLAGIDGEPIPELTDQQLLTGGKVDDLPLDPRVFEQVKASVRSKMPGRGYPKLDKPKGGYDINRGAVVFAKHCSACHGVDGQGYTANGINSLPPLWGPNAFNHGAGMHRVNTAAYYIYVNMPFGKSIQLSEQEAWDVAAYINSNERPQDPRFNGSVAETDAAHHNHDCFYGDNIYGSDLGSKAFPNHPHLHSQD